MHPPQRTLRAEALSAEAFRPFGDVIEASETARRVAINSGTADRYDDLARLDVTRQGGRPLLGIVRATPRTLPMALTVLERHPLGSQAFIPLSAHPFMVVVALGGDSPDVTTLCCFMSAPGQGVNYHAGVWHHPLIALYAQCEFLVVDRGGPEPNCDEVALPRGGFCV